MPKNLCLSRVELATLINHRPAQLSTDGDTLIAQSDIFKIRTKARQVIALQLHRHIPMQHGRLGMQTTKRLIETQIAYRGIHIRVFGNQAAFVQREDQACANDLKWRHTERLQGRRDL